jgi:hypothetical protein
MSPGLGALFQLIKEVAFQENLTLSARLNFAFCVTDRLAKWVLKF